MLPFLDHGDNREAVAAVQRRAAEQMLAAGYVVADLADVPHRMPERGEGVSVTSLGLPPSTILVQGLVRFVTTEGDEHALRGTIRLSSMDFDTRWDFDARATRRGSPPLETLALQIDVLGHLPAR